MDNEITTRNYCAYCKQKTTFINVHMERYESVFIHDVEQFLLYFVSTCKKCNNNSYKQIRSLVKPIDKVKNREIEERIATPIIKLVNKPISENVSDSQSDYPSPSPPTKGKEHEQTYENPASEDIVNTHKDLATEEIHVKIEDKKKPMSQAFVRQAKRAKRKEENINKKKYLLIL